MQYFSLLKMKLWLSSPTLLHLSFPLYFQTKHCLKRQNETFYPFQISFFPC